MIIFDIETGPLPDEQILPLFDVDGVKFGNTKDEAKRAAIVEAAKAKFVERAALDPLTGQVVAIGYHAAEAEPVVIGVGWSVKTEADVLAHFWETFAYCSKAKRPLAGWNTHGFDLPFLVRRSWINDVAVPQGLLERGRYWHETFVDLMQIFSCGKYGDFVSLHRACQAFGLAGKNGSGADFHRLWTEDRDKAIAYLLNDVKQTYEVAARMGVA